MSENFNKSCYTTRSSGYKYRTLSTNTGERKRRDSKEDNAFDKKFKELKREITARINNQVEQTQAAREHIQEKFDKMNTKINTMLELQDTVHSLRIALRAAEDRLSGMLDKVDKLEAVTAGSDAYSLYSHKSSLRSAPPIFEEKEMADVKEVLAYYNYPKFPLH